MNCSQRHRACLVFASHYVVCLSTYQGRSQRNTAHLDASRALGARCTGARQTLPGARHILWIASWAVEVHLACNQTSNA